MINRKCNHSLCNQAKNNSLTDDDYKLILKENNLSITKPRLLILKMLMGHGLPLTVEEILKKLGKDACDMATIYRVLAQFLEVQLVNAIHLAKDLVHYEYNNPHHHHHHIICTSCKKVDLFEDCFLEKIETNLHKIGYQNLNHKLEFFGTCKDCLSA